MAIKSVCLIAVYDSYLKALMPLARFLKSKKIEVKLLVTENIADRIVGELANDFSHERISSDKLRKGKFKNEEFDVIFLGAGGAELRSIVKALHEAKAILVSLFPGVTGSTIYQGFNDRSATDVMMLSNIADFEKYKKYAADFRLGAKPFMSGFANLFEVKNDGGRNIVFIDQNFPTMSYSEKAYTLERLIDLARVNPSRDVVIKLRNKKGEVTPHLARTSFTKLLKKIKPKVKLPKNLRLSHEPLEKVLASADLCISVSSAAIIEALYNNIKCVIVSDFGVRQEFGNEIYVGSGLFASFENILDSKIPKVNPEWYENFVVPAEEKYAELLKLLESSKPGSRVGFEKKQIMKEIVRKKDIYGGVELSNEIFMRKYKKLKTAPGQFFSDSDNIVVKVLGKLLKK